VPEKTLTFSNSGPRYVFHFQNSTLHSATKVCSSEYDVVSEIPGITHIAEPLTLEIAHHIDHVQAKCSALCAEGIGMSRDIALNELFDFIRSELNILRATSPEDLSDSANSLREKYLKYFP